MVGIESYHTPRHVGAIRINKADSLSQGCGKGTRGTVCTGTDKGPHMLALQIVVMLRTWSNGWFTTHRTLHEATGGARLPCIYGCGGPDSLVHYLQCEHMWTLICSCTNSPTSSLSTPLAQRICLVNPNRCNISSVCQLSMHTMHKDIIIASILTRLFLPQISVTCF